MADPHIKSPMDIWDKLTVIIIAQACYCGI